MSLPCTAVGGGKIEGKGRGEGGQVGGGQAQIREKNLCKEIDMYMYMYLVPVIFQILSRSLVWGS